MLARAALIVLSTLGVMNLGTLWLVQACALGRSPIEIQTRSAYQARVSEFFAEPVGSKRAVFLGDSLVYGAHLKAQSGQQLDRKWHDLTLAQRFVTAAKAQRRVSYRALNLGINGVLFSELRCVASDVLAQAPDLLVINVSPRPFSRDFRIPVAQTERSFLCPSRASTTHRLHQAVTEQLARVSPIVRYRDLIQFAWLESTPRERVLRAVDARLAASPASEPEPLDEDEAELAEIMREMAWRTKAASRYNAIRVSTDHPQAGELAALLTMLARNQRTHILLFYLEENVAALEGQLDLEHYRSESAKFIELVRAQTAGTRVRFVVVPAAPLQGHYTDHIHLDAQGYAMLADALVAASP